MKNVLTVIAVASLTGCATHSDISPTRTIQSNGLEFIEYTNNKTGIDSLITNQAVKSFKTDYQKAPSNKAFAQSVSGAWNWKSNRSSVEHARTSALVGCQRNNKKSEDIYPCKVIHVNDEWVEPVSVVNASEDSMRSSIAAPTRPHVWSDHKQLAMDSGVCRIKATDILTALGFSNVVTSPHGDYVYGNYVGNRAAVKCVPLGEGTFLYASVAGPDVKEVERLRNEIMWQY